MSAAGEVYSVIPDHPVIQPSNRYDIENYFEHNVGTGEFKVLVVESRSRLAFWAVRRHYKSAAGAAKKDCQDYTQSFNCQIFAVGGTIVWDMSSREREQTINDYGAGKLQEEDEENKTYVKGIRMEIFVKNSSSFEKTLTAFDNVCRRHVFSVKRFRAFKKERVKICINVDGFGDITVSRITGARKKRYTGIERNEVVQFR